MLRCYNLTMFQCYNVTLLTLSLLGLDKRRNDPQMIRWMNVRHPLSRLLSAWRNKFSIHFVSSMKWMRWYGEKIFELMTEDDYFDKQYYVPFTSFLKFIIWSWQNDPNRVKIRSDVHPDSNINAHWLTFFHACSPCVMKVSKVIKNLVIKTLTNFINLSINTLQNKSQRMQMLILF